MMKVKDESIFSRLHQWQCNVPSPKRSRKCPRRIAKLTAAVSRVSLKYFLLLRVWPVQTLLRPVMVSPFSCYSLILLLILESLGAESLSLSLSLSAIPVKPNSGGRGAMSGIVSRKFCKFVASSQAGASLRQPPEWCRAFQTRPTSAAVLQTQLLQLVRISCCYEGLPRR